MNRDNGARPIHGNSKLTREPMSLTSALERAADTETLAPNLYVKCELAGTGCMDDAHVEAITS